MWGIRGTLRRVPASSRPPAPDDWLAISDLIELTGLSSGAIRWRLWASLHDVPTNPPMPAPDRYFGRSPAWRWSTIHDWVETLQRRR